MTGVCLTLLISATLPLVAELLRLEKLKRRWLEIASHRNCRTRIVWTEEEAEHSSRMFYRLFRMKKSSFRRLCHRIESAVGETNFRSQQHLEAMADVDSGDLGSSQAGRMYRNSRNFSGDYVSGEWKVGLALRYLAGATCLDLYS